MGEHAKPYTALLRFSGEIGTKARATRQQFARRLVQNVRDALEAEGVPVRMQPTRDRITVELPDPSAANALQRVFGVQSVSVSERHDLTQLSDIVTAAEHFFRERVRGRRFAVRARRVGNRDRIAVSSHDVELELGTALLPGSAGVDLGNPEVTAYVELTQNASFFFSEILPGASGLPLGVEGKAIALLSGGFDSAVAAWYLLRRGVALDYVFCNMGGPTHEEGALRVAKVLADRWSYGDRPRLHAIDFEPLAEALRECTEKRYWQVLLKRLMLRAAEAVARMRGAEAIVTGEAVGQVSSQTLRNLASISRATDLTILRPLVGHHKDEIIGLAEHLGTAELSKVVGEYCAMVPRNPATGASLEALLAEEEHLDLSLVDSAVALRRVIDLRQLDVEASRLPELETDRIPEGATVIDLRTKDEFASWHWKDALWLDFSQAMRAYPRFDRSQPYVLYCAFGLKSAHLAGLMRREGLDAHHFHGGVKALRRLAP